MEKKTIISVKDLIKNYGSFEAVKGISFAVYENEIFGLLGLMVRVNQRRWKLLKHCGRKQAVKFLLMDMTLIKNPARSKRSLACSYRQAVITPASIWLT